MIQNGGYVYGAVLDTDLVVLHIEAQTIDELEKTRNSKYVQSDIGFCYKKAKERLDEEKEVLLSGTPCQIAGLRNYLNKEYNNLLTVDILCHGVTSPGLWHRYIDDEERIGGSKIEDVRFRSKEIGWKKFLTSRTFVNGETANWPDTFISGFLQNYYLRDSCYTCLYATASRQGDISLRDYWEYQESAPEYFEDDDKGISLVIISSKKGAKAFKAIQRRIVFAERTIIDAKRGNPVLYKPDRYDEFWKDAVCMDWNGLKSKNLSEQDTSEWMSIELRKYYDKSFSRRHLIHKFRCILEKCFYFFHFPNCNSKLQQFLSL